MLFDTQNWTALHYAACFRHVDVVKVLIQEGADVNLFRQTNDAAIDYAADGMTMTFDVVRGEWTVLFTCTVPTKMLSSRKDDSRGGYNVNVKRETHAGVAKC